MPVGCLGNAARGAKEEPFRKNGTDNFETILTSSRLNSSDQFAFMQHTLLLQIFRDPDDEDQARSSPSSDESTGSLLCPTCVGFSDQCCQQDNGIDIFNSFIEANLNCHWDLKLSEAVSSLRYQGYVCPGILVLIANASHLEVVTDAWHRRLVTSPNGCRISQVGISNGCLVKPIVQTHTISLPDFLCLLLARLKQTEQTVDMETLCKAVERDWNGVAPFCRTNGMENLKETIHTSLGGLIKARKIYYTGNKGYFLVANDANSSRGGEPKSWRRSLPKRLSFRNSKGSSPSNNNNNNGNAQNSSDKECQTDGFFNGQITPGSSTPIGKLSPDKCPVKFGSVSPKSCSDEMSPSSVVANGNESSFNLERSQSLRISRNSLRNISKGGSLRFSKKEVAKLMEEQEEKELSVETNGGELTPPKQFERKNSFLGKIFGGSNKKKGQSSAPKPILATFSAQFPPPEVSEIAADHHATYQALKKAAQSIYNSPPPSLTVPPLIPAHEEEMMYDRPINGHDRGNNSRTTTAATADNNCPIYSKVSPFRKKDNVNVQQQQPENGGQHQQNIYSVGSPLSVYGYSVGGTPDCVYSYPPPPLPYRPINWTNGPNSLQSSSSSTSSPIQRQINSPTLRQINSPTNRSQNSASPSSTTPGTPQQKLQQQLLNNQQQLQLQQLHQQQQQQIQQYHQLQQNSNTTSPWSTPSKRTANQMSTNLVNSILNTNSTNSTTATSSSSNDSLVLESRTTKPLFNDDLIVIERSNRELELRLAASKQQQQHLHQQQIYHQQHQEQLYQAQKHLNNQLQQEQQYQTQKQLNNQLQQEQQYQQHREQIYHQQHQREQQLQQHHQQQQEQFHKQQKEQQDKEQQVKEQKEEHLNRKEDSPAAKSGKNRAIRFTLPSSSQKNRSAIVIDTIHNNNIGGFADVIYEECSHSDEVERIKKKISSRPLSECFSASQDNLGDEKSLTPQSFPSIGDLPSLSELSGNATFKSLTAQKLMSGVSFNSVDTLLEVNLAAEARNKHNESTETIDFGVI